MKKIMKNDNIITMLPKWIFIIGWSKAIAKQNTLFDRQCNDYDIMLNFDTFTILKPFLEKQWVLDESKYSIDGIYTVTFDDWSNIDIMIQENTNFIEKDWLKYLKIEEIIQYKIRLVKNNIISWLQISDNKHVKDILFLMDKHNSSKYSEYFITVF